MATFADNLLPQKARLLLSLALTVTTDPEQIARRSTQYQGLGDVQIDHSVISPPPLPPSIRCRYAPGTSPTCSLNAT